MGESLILAGAVIAVGAAWAFPRLLGSRRRESSSVPSRGTLDDGGFYPVIYGDRGSSNTDNDNHCADADAGADAGCSDSGSDGGGGGSDGGGGDGGGGGD